MYDPAQIHGTSCCVCFQRIGDWETIDGEDYCPRHAPAIPPCPTHPHGDPDVTWERDDQGDWQPIAWTLACGTCGQTWDVTP